ncbi:hypothetical protein SAMN04488134_11311 [Amphibacillus marinus]|uniref:Uncharacterized protein n=1 Tax=Amphibacillus marinus TaxID=872970 RepID=A0A1H8SJX4_9BACI|nr:hypothetical protein [Amphibacillus marinus]SEO78941.1 hypothetical protein SAMN04488134_11311 [Amphibacillus marinus]
MMDVEMILTLVAVIATIFKNFISAWKDINDIKLSTRKRKRRPRRLKRRHLKF